MKRICIGGAGGVAGIGMTRCLQGHGYDLVGYDGSVWGELAMECPLADDPYMSDMIIPVPDGLVSKYVGMGKIAEAADLCFLPSKEVVEICQDKAKTAEILKELAPRTFWVRDTHGAGGAGAQMASEFLPGRNYSCELVYDKGELLGYFIKQRLAYDIKGRKDPLWQRGSSVVSICVDDKDILNKSKEAISRLTPEPHGVFAIDFKENEQGERKITEINPGRFLTASYPFFLDLDYNLPLLMVKAFFNEPLVLGDYPVGWGVIRQQDSLPTFFSPEKTKSWEK